MAITNPVELAAMRAAFEAAINAKANVYNLTPSAGLLDGDATTYWSMQTERAWVVFQSAWVAAKEHFRV